MLRLLRTSDLAALSMHPAPLLLKPSAMLRLAIVTCAPAAIATFGMEKLSIRFAF
jgi:hypothetical protein